MSSTSPALQTKVAVIGPTGRLGREVVVQLSQRSIPTKCLLRHDIPPPLLSAPPKALAPGMSAAEVAAYLSALPHVDMAKGDVTDAGSVRALLADCTACLAVHGAGRRSRPSDLLPWARPEDDPAHPKRVNYEGVRNIIAAAKASPVCRRVVRVTGKGEAPWSPVSILINLLGSMAKAWNYEGEGLLRGQGDVEYTIVRPGVMGRARVPGGRVLALADNGGDLPVSAVRHAAIADLCVRCLEHPNAGRATLCAMNVAPGKGAETYGPLLAAVKGDTRAFPASLLEEHRRAVRAGAAGLGVALAVALAAVGRCVRGWRSPG